MSARLVIAAAAGSLGNDDDGGNSQDDDQLPCDAKRAHVGLEQLLEVTQDRRRRELLLHQVKVTVESAERSLPSPYARAQIERQLQRAAHTARDQVVLNIETERHVARGLHD